MYHLSPAIGGKRDKAAVKLTVVCEAPIKLNLPPL